MSDKFSMHKEDYMVNTLSMGIAVQYLCNLTGKSFNYWAKQISEQANSQCDQLTPEQIDKTIQDYLKNRTSKNDASITKLGNDNTK